MKSSIAIIIFCFVVAFLPGCSGKPSTNVDANANTAGPEKETQFSGMTDANAALAEGNRLLDDNQTEKAIDAFRQAIKLNPDLAEAHFQLGIAYALIESERKLSGADVETPANSAKKGEPAKPDSQKEFERAVEAYKKWLKTNLKDDAAQFNLGRAYNKLNQDEEAEDAFQEAVDLKPTDTEYQTELGAIRIKLAKFHEAIPVLKEALKLDPDNARAESLLEDAEAGARRIEYSQTEANKKAGSGTGSKSNSNSSANANTAGKPANVDAKPKKEDPKDKKGEKPPKSGGRPN